MSYSICFIGDSQVASLRQGLNDPRLNVHSHMMTIFGSIAARLFELKAEDGALVSDSAKVRNDLYFTGGSRSIKLRKYDAFCVVGAMIKLDTTGGIARDYATVAMNLSGRHLVSERLLQLMYEEVMRKSLAHHLITLLEGSGKPVFFIPCPLHAEDIVSHEKGDIIRSMMDAGLGDDHFGRFARARDKILGPKAEIIHQPEETIAPPFFTKRDYSVGSVRLKKELMEHGGDDFNHMNQDFGVLMLNKAVDVIVSSLDAQKREEGAAASAAP